MSQYFGEERRACVAREISKIHEDYQRGTLKELIAHFNTTGVKGEIVLIVAGCLLEDKKIPQDEE